MSTNRLSDEATYTPDLALEIVQVEVPRMAPEVEQIIIQGLLTSVQTEDHASGTDDKDLN